MDFDFVMMGKSRLTKSMQNYSTCGAKPNEMIDRNLNNFKPCEGTLIYGLSPLHAWIQFFECLPHVPCRLEIKTWRLTKKFKAKYIERKKLILKKMYDAFGLKVDMARFEGAETSTTGNVCRKAFSNPALLSEVLGIDKNLIIRFSNILDTINFNNSIDPTKQTIVTKLTKFSSILMVTSIKFLLQFTKSLHMVLITF